MRKGGPLKYPPPSPTRNYRKSTKFTKRGTGVEGWMGPVSSEKEGFGWVWIHEKKPTANRRESRPSGSQNRICFSSLEPGGHLASLSTCSAEVVRFASNPPSSRRFIPHRERSGKSCRRSSGSCEEYSECFLYGRDIGKSPLGGFEKKIVGRVWFSFPGDPRPHICLYEHNAIYKKCLEEIINIR